MDRTSIYTVLLAGGFGTRVAHLLPKMPKPMAPVAGRPFVEWVVRYFAHFGLGHFILSTGYFAEVIEKYFTDNPIKGIEVGCRKETAPLGTAGGFLHATEQFVEPLGGWLVANGDSLVVADPTVLFQAARKNEWEAVIMGLEVADASRFGSLRVADDGTLLAFAEKRPGAGLINTGVYWFGRGCRAGFPAKRPLSFEMDVFPALVASGTRIGVVPVTAPFIDIGTPESLAAAEAFVRANFETHIG